MAWQDRDYHRAGYGGGGPAAFGGRSGMTVFMWLIAINCAVFIIDSIFTGSSRLNALSLARAGWFTIEQAVYGLQLWRWITYQFLHANFFHLLFNMIGLYFFGRLIESQLGGRRFLAFYLLCGASGGVLFTILAFIPGLLNADSTTPVIGASGSLFGILAGCAVLFPHQRVMLMFPPIPMSMRTLAIAVLVIAALSVISGSHNAGGEAAHLGGAALGFFLIRRPNLLAFADRIGRGVPGQAWLRHQQKKTRRRRVDTASEQAEVDRILEKVREQGLHGLSAREKRALKRATDRQRRVG